MIASASTATGLRWAPRAAKRGELPKISPTLLKLFGVYTRVYLRRHFGFVYLGGSAPPFSVPARPTIIFLNHASWWDPLICLLLREGFTARFRNYAPIDSVSLSKFRFFGKLGFFGVDKNSRRGTLSFLQTSKQILSQPDSVLWVTPQGDFVDPRARPAQLKKGLGYLTTHNPEVRLIPLALDYFFSGDRLPSAAALFGKPVDSALLSNATAEQRTHQLSEALERTQDTLEDEIVSKRIFAAPTLLRGKSGVGGIYGIWQSLRRRGC